jgi:hypothetical protein
MELLSSAVVVRWHSRNNGPLTTDEKEAPSVTHDVGASGIFSPLGIFRSLPHAAQELGASLVLVRPQPVLRGATIAGGDARANADFDTFSPVFAQKTGPVKIYGVKSVR